MSNNDWSTTTLLSNTPILMGDNTIPGLAIPKEIVEIMPKVFEAADDFGLDYYETIMEWMTYDGISEVAAYDGFPQRYPHWRHGMAYEELSKGYEFGQFRIFEMVVNCCDPQTSILTSKGSKSAGDVVVGDVVFSRNGARKVVYVARQPSSKVVKVNLKEFGQNIVCTPNHKWMVLRSSQSEWVEAEKLVPGDMILAGGKYENFLSVSPAIVWDGERVKNNTLANVRWKLEPITPPKCLTVELAELIGICTGDGSTGVAGAENAIAVAVGKGLNQYQDHIGNLFFKVFGRQAKCYEKAAADSIQLNSKYAVDYMDSIGLKKRVTFESKRIPHIIWRSSNEYRAAFIRGVFDTDGHCGKSLSMSSKSEGLVKDVQLLLLEMGIRSKVSYIHNVHNDIWLLTIKGRLNQLLFRKYIGFSLDYKKKALESLVSSTSAVGHGFKLFDLQRTIMARIAALEDQKKLPQWMKRTRHTAWKEIDHGVNSLWNFVKRVMESGYDGFEDVLQLLETPMYEVKSVKELPELQETVDIALDHDDHDFLANGLISHNTQPCRIYFLNSNTFTDNVTVMGHALGHNDFFKNNIWFKPTNTNMMNEFGNNRTRVMEIESRWGEDTVESFLDDCLAIDSLIDPANAWNKRKYSDPVNYDEREYSFPRRLKIPEGHDYMEDWINPKAWVTEEWNRINVEETKKSLGIVEMYDRDIVKFILENAPLKPWEQTILGIIYDEAMYFAPQGMTKTVNEGWACADKESRIISNKGILKLGDVVDGKLKLEVDGGEVVNWFKFSGRDTLKLKTRRGFEITGSKTHRLMVKDGSWKRLDEFMVGDEVELRKGSNIWSSDQFTIDWKLKKRVPLKEVCSIPDIVDERLASFLGYMIGDGHISDKKRTLGLTTGDEDRADNYIKLVKDLFNLECNKRWDDSSKNGRWRISVYSKNLQDFLVHLGLTTGVSARLKTIPNCILKSPKKVMSAFLRSYFDCDGGAYRTGIILSTSSVEMSKILQVVLLNYGIFSRRCLKDNWHVAITGKSAKVFMDEIGFGLKRKQEALEKYISDHEFFKEEYSYDEVVEIVDMGKQDVYDITVESSHSYVAQGFINHNSFVDFNIMARVGMPNCSIWEYADHKASVLGGKYSQNPYKLGFELLLDIEDRWNKGRFGKEYEQCKDNQRKENWDLQLGLGHQKVFDVREKHNDVTMLVEFFTEDFCRKHDFFNWVKRPSSHPGVEAEYKLLDRDWKKSRNALIQRHLNRGLPDIRLVDPNGKGKNVLVLQHTWDGRTLQPRYSREALRSLYVLWRNPVAILTKSEEGKDLIYYCDDKHLVRELRRGEWLQM